MLLCFLKKGVKLDKLKFSKSLRQRTFEIGLEYETPLIRHVTRARLDCATANGCVTLFQHYAARRRVLSRPARASGSADLHRGTCVFLCSLTSKARFCMYSDAASMPIGAYGYISRRQARPYV
jgi:hypothetical protein